MGFAQLAIWGLTAGKPYGMVHEVVEIRQPIRDGEIPRKGKQMSVCPTRILKEAMDLLQQHVPLGDEDLDERVANSVTELEDLVRWFDQQGLPKVQISGRAK